MPLNSHKHHAVGIIIKFIVFGKGRKHETKSRNDSVVNILNPLGQKEGAGDAGRASPHRSANGKKYRLKLGLKAM